MASQAPAASSPQAKRKPAERSQSRTASRTLDILEHFGRVKRPVRAIEIVRALDLQPSTANQILKTLVASSHVVFDAKTKTYLPSPRLAVFGTWVGRSYGDDRLEQLLHDVQQSTDAPIVTLSTANDLKMQLLDRACSPTWRGSETRGRHVPVFGSVAIGSAYLSTLPDREVRRLSARARLPRQSLPELLSAMSRVRQDGIAAGISVESRMAALAIPLQRCGPVPMVLAMADDAEHVQRNRPALELQMREAVDRLA